MESYEISDLYGTQDREQFFHKWFDTKRHKTFGCIQAQMQTLKFKVRAEIHKSRFMNPVKSEMLFCRKDSLQVPCRV